MTIGQVLTSARQKFHNKSEDFLAIEILLAYCLGKERKFLFAHPELDIDTQSLERFYSLFDRFSAGEPVAYLTNQKEFYGLNFYVDNRVLIPRPETEMIVDKVLEAAKKFNGSELRILDVGTGSGCIAIAIAKNLPSAQILGVDVSSDALEVAQKNAKNHDVTQCVVFQKSDLLKNIIDSFDIVVANLPYIGNEKYNFVSKETFDYEPHVALFGGKNGLILYEQLFQQLMNQSWKPKLLLGEFGFLQGEELRQLLNQYFVQWKWSIIKDFASIERVFVVKFCS